MTQTCRPSARSLWPLCTLCIHFSFAKQIRHTSGESRTHDCRPSPVRSCFRQQHMHHSTLQCCKVRQKYAWLIMHARLQAEPRAQLSLAATDSSATLKIQPDDLILYRCISVCLCVGRGEGGGEIQPGAPIRQRCWNYSFLLGQLPEQQPHIYVHLMQGKERRRLNW